MADDHRHNIPSHIIFFHILPRLPVESLQRCKSVCKQWHLFLKKRLFSSLYNRRLTNGSALQLRHKLLLLPCNYYPPGFRIMDCEAPDDGLITQHHSFPFQTNRYTKNRILTSLHGLICAVCVPDRLTELVLWNPLTKEYKMLGKTNPHMHFYFSKVKALGLYYTNMSDYKDYKLLTVSSDDVNLTVDIYSLKSDSWRKVDLADNYQALSHLGQGMIGSSTWLNGNLYFLKERSVLKFDTKLEKFTIIPTYPSLKDLDVKSLTMNEQKGVIYLGVNYETSQHQNSKKAHIQVWRLIEDENWEKVGAPYRVDISMYPFHWLGNKTWLMVEQQQLYKVDYNKSYTKGKNYITKDKSAPIIDMRYYSYTKVNYIESFMSIDGSL